MTIATHARRGWSSGAGRGVVSAGVLSFVLRFAIREFGVFGFAAAAVGGFLALRPDGVLRSP